MHWAKQTTDRCYSAYAPASGTYALHFVTGTSTLGETVGNAGRASLRLPMPQHSNRRALCAIGSFDLAGRTPHRVG